MTVSTVPARRPSPSSAMRMRRGPSKPNGLVTTATVSASSSLASEAITGAAPVPVPPPRPAVTNTMSAPCSSSTMASVFSSAACRPISGFDAGAQTLGDLGAELQFVGHLARRERLDVRVHGVELHAFEALRHHAGHGVAAAAAHADHLDARAGARLFFHLVFQIVHVHIAVDDAHAALLTSTSSRSRWHFPSATRHVP